MIFLFFLIVSISTQAQDLCSISSSYVFENKDPMAVELTLKKQWVDREAVLSLQVDGQSCSFDQRSLNAHLDRFFTNYSREQILQTNAVVYMDKKLDFFDFKMLSVWLHFYGLDQIFIALDQMGRTVYVPFDLMQAVRYDYIATNLQNEKTALDYINELYPNTYSLELNAYRQRQFERPIDYFPHQVLDVEVNESGRIMYNGQIINLMSLSTLVQLAIQENYKESIQLAMPRSYFWIDFKVSTQSSFDTFIQIYSSAIDAFYAHWDEKAFMEYGMPFEELTAKKQIQIKNSSPMLIMANGEIVRNFLRKFKTDQPVKWTKMFTD